MPSSNSFPAQARVARRQLLRLGLALAALSMAGGAHAQPAKGEPLKVVATFSILGDMVKEIGGDRVAITTIVGPNTDSHRFEPTPRDAKAMQQAAVLVLNGLDFEAWLPRLVQASGFNGLQILASKGVKVRRLQEGGQAGREHRHGAGPHEGHAHGDVDPHAWQDLANGIIYAQNIASGLAKADPRNADYYAGRLSSYVARMKTLDAEIRTALSAIPRERRRVISSHDAFGYFGAAYGVDFIPVAGLSNQAEPSARDVARIIELARENGVSGVFIENMSNPLLAQQIARESNALMGGTLYADALSPPGSPAATYLGMLSWNAGRLVYVLQQAAK